MITFLVTYKTSGDSKTRRWKSESEASLREMIARQFPAWEILSVTVATD